MASMSISAIHIYPIKSLRGTTVSSAPLTPHGLPYDRRFMILKIHPDASTNPRKTGSRYENMTITYYPAMCLFTTALDLPQRDDGTTDWSGSSGHGSVNVTYTDPSDGHTSDLTIPLHPDTSSLATIDINLHQSTTTGFFMPQSYSTWFSSRFGFDVVLAYLGPSYRPVLGNLAPNASSRNAIRRAEAEKANTAPKSKSWLSGLVNNMPGLPTVFSNGNSNVPSTDTNAEKQKEDYEITFADVAPYLLISRTSFTNVSKRLPPTEEMEIEKFRPNIIVDGAAEEFEEDFWAEVTIHGDQGEGVALNLTNNCVRCASLNVDWETGKFGTGEKGSVLKKLQRDRRVDRGHKYGPVFGRYAFLPYDALRGERTIEISTGDRMEVTRRNDDRTTLMWPGLGQTPKEEHYPVC